MLFCDGVRLFCRVIILQVNLDFPHRVTSLRTAVDTLILKGFNTFKSGSCFADLAAQRPLASSQYNNEYFFRKQAIVVPVLIEGDIEGAACETQANILPRMVNVLKIEGFARKEFVRSAHSLIRKVDLLFLQGRRTMVEAPTRHRIHCTDALCDCGRLQGHSSVALHEEQDEAAIATLQRLFSHRFNSQAMQHEEETSQAARR